MRMSSRSGRRSRSRSRSREPRRSGRRDEERPWLRRSRSRSRSSDSSSRSRSPRRKSRRSRSKSPVRPVMSKEPRYLSSRVFVANLASDRTSNAELQALFEKHGKVVDTLVHHNGYGFIQFTNEEDGRKAVAAETGTHFHGKILKCNMAAEGKKGGGGSGGGGGGSSSGGRGPTGDRFERDRSPMRDPYAPPFEDPYLRGRDLPPPPRDLPLPPRDPYFDDPYRRPPPPDLYFDRFRDDPYRRDPYALDPYRDPYRDPYGPSLYDPIAPKKPVTVDCEIVIMSSELRRYADIIDHRLKNINLLTNVVVIREDRTIQQQVEDASRRSCLFAIVINSQNEIHRSLTLNILHGVAQAKQGPVAGLPAIPPQQYQQQDQQQEELKSKILSMMNGASASPAQSSMPLPKNTLVTHPASIMASAISAKPPPPPPPSQANSHTSNALLGAISQKPNLTATTPPSASTGQGPAPAATLINFDNPTVQKALDNLIQSGPNLLRTISTSQVQTAWPGLGTTTSTAQPGRYPAAPGPQHPPY